MMSGEPLAENDMRLTEQQWLDGLDQRNSDSLPVAKPKSAGDMDRFWADVERAVADRDDSTQVVIFDSPFYLL